MAELAWTPWICPSSQAHPRGQAWGLGHVPVPNPLAPTSLTLGPRPAANIPIIDFSSHYAKVREAWLYSCCMATRHETGSCSRLLAPPPPPPPQTTRAAGPATRSQDIHTIGQSPRCKDEANLGFMLLHVCATWGIIRRLSASCKYPPLTHVLSDKNSTAKQCQDTAPGRFIPLPRGHPFQGCKEDKELVCVLIIHGHENEPC